jgi:hypothetical protein
MQYHVRQRLRRYHLWTTRTTRLLLVLLLVQGVALCALPGACARAESAVPAAAAAPLGQRPGSVQPPALSIEPYVRPEVAQRMIALRPTILAAAARHNHPVLSGMDDAEFAQVIALVLYNEHNGWLEDRLEVLRPFTPWYEAAQVGMNRSGLGSDFSIWPANLRPSVALEILRGQVPLPTAGKVLTVPLRVAHSQVVPAEHRPLPSLYAEIAREISQDALAVEYLAANLERGLYRAHYEGVPVSWRTLAAWHNQGIVHPQQVRANSHARDYVRRASAYLPLARSLILMERTTRRNLLAPAPDPQAAGS